MQIKIIFLSRPLSACALVPLVFMELSCIQTTALTCAVDWIVRRTLLCHILYCISLMHVGQVPFKWQSRVWKQVLSMRVCSCRSSGTQLSIRVRSGVLAWSAPRACDALALVWSSIFIYTLWHKRKNRLRRGKHAVTAVEVIESAGSAALRG